MTLMGGLGFTQGIGYSFAGLTSSCLAPLDAFARLSSFKGGFFRERISILNPLPDQLIKHHKNCQVWCRDRCLVLMTRSTYPDLLGAGFGEGRVRKKAGGG